jgi:hypothetical protein
MPVPLSRTRISTASPTAVTLAPRGRVEGIAEQVQEHPRHVLRIDLDRRNAFAKIPLQRDIETLILCAGTVVGEVQCLIDQRVQIDHSPLGR